MYSGLAQALPELFKTQYHITQSNKLLYMSYTCIAFAQNKIYNTNHSQRSVEDRAIASVTALVVTAHAHASVSP